MEENKWKLRDNIWINIETGTRFDLNGYDKYGYDRSGLDRDGYNRHGFSYLRSNFGIHRITGTERDEKGFDIKGYDEDGYDRDGYDKNGYNYSAYLKCGNKVYGIDPTNGIPGPEVILEAKGNYKNPYFTYEINGVDPDGNSNGKIISYNYQI